jgi:hypothetical protein
MSHAPSPSFLLSFLSLTDSIFFYFLLFFFLVYIFSSLFRGGVLIKAGGSLDRLI